MENREFHSEQPRQDRREVRQEETIPVVREEIEVGKELVESGKVRIIKHVREEKEVARLPLMSEEYEVKHVPVNRIVDTPPPALQQNGETMIIPVIREVVVKKYEIVEELHVTRKVYETIEAHEFILRKEEIEVKRTNIERDDRSAR
jgi:stress response protein YsnF